MKVLKPILRVRSSIESFIGSALFSAVILLFPKVRDFMVNFVMLVSNAYSEYLYRLVGYADKDVFSVLSYVMFISSLVSIPIVATILLRGDIARIKERANSLLMDKEECESIEDRTAHIRKRLEDSKRRIKKTETQLLYLTIFLCIPVICMIGHAVTLTYSHDLVINIERSIDIISPFVHETERLSYISRFRQIENKEQYDSLMKDLSQIASDNGFKLPGK